MGWWWEGHGDMAKVSVISEEGEPAEIAHDLQRSWGAWQPPNHERLAGGHRRLVGEEESVDTRRCLTRSRCLSVADRSPERLLWRTPLSALFDPALRWARNASRSSEGLSCRSASGPMFTTGTEGPTVGWGGASPRNCVQLDLISLIKSSFQLLIMAGEGPCEGFTASGCVTVGATEARPGADGGTGFPGGWTKGGVAPEKTPRKHRGVGEHFSESGKTGIVGGTGAGPPGNSPGKRPEGPGSPAKAAGGRAGWNALTAGAVTAGPVRATPREREEPRRRTQAAASWSRMLELGLEASRMSPQRWGKA